PRAPAACGWRPRRRPGPPAACGRRTRTDGSWRRPFTRGGTGRGHRGSRGPIVLGAAERPGAGAGRREAASRYPGGMHREGQRGPDSPVPPTSAAGSAPRRATSRRSLLHGAGTIAALGTVGAAGAGALAASRLSRPATDPRTVILLWSGTVAYD